MFVEKFSMIIDRERSFIRARFSLWSQSIFDIVVISYFYVFIEWIFYVTMPSLSFMYMLDLGERVRILFISGLFVSIILIAVLIIFFLIDLAFFSITNKIINSLPFVPESFLLSCLFLTVLDNFTYTVFQFGIATTSTLGHAIYLVVFILFTCALIKELTSKNLKKANKNIQLAKRSAVVVLLGFSLIMVSVPSTITINNEPEQITSTITHSYPNIIILETDGLDADSMSAYGYERDTTPFIREWVKTSLISENNFSNSRHSMGADTALLTGRLPFDTRVLFPPDILRGEDTYLHLPGILKEIGYNTVQLGVPYYIDANAANFQNAFKAVNYSNNSNLIYQINRLTSFSLDDVFYFLISAGGNLKDNLFRIFFIDNKRNPISQVTQVPEFIVGDQERLKCLYSYLDKANKSGQPLFAQLHMMVTHGPTFDTEHQIFSKGEDQNQIFKTDFYDDAILDFDNYVKEFVDYLKQIRQYNNTIIVLTSDHGQMWTTGKRIPLIIHFPNNGYTKMINENTQSIDIAPTILDYLGVIKPDWMDGESLLGNLSKNRLIVTASTGATILTTSGVNAIPVNEQSIKPPFFQFSELIAIQCQNISIFNLIDLSVSEGEVSNYVNPCAADSLDKPEIVRSHVIDFLKSFNYGDFN